MREGVFDPQIEKGEFVDDDETDASRLCSHKCKDRLFTIVTDFVLPYDATREMITNNGYY